MDSKEKKIQQLEYHQALLLQMIDKKKHPFFEMIIQRGLQKEEVTEIYELCEALTKEYEEQKELGFVYFQSLLQHFFSTLNKKLDPLETIETLYLQNLYKPLMVRLQKLLKDEL